MLLGGTETATRRLPSPEPSPAGLNITGIGGPAPVPAPDPHQPRGADLPLPPSPAAAQPMLNVPVATALYTPATHDRKTERSRRGAPRDRGGPHPAPDRTGGHRTGSQGAAANVVKRRAGLLFGGRWETAFRRRPARGMRGV